MAKIIKIAIYTGVVPSSTFIERLIQGLAKKGLHIFLFGVQRKQPTSIKNVFHFTCTKRKFCRLLQLFKYSFLLTFFRIKDKRKLDNYIGSQNRNSRQLKIKYYPVLYRRPDIFHLQWAKSIEDWLWVQDFGIKLIVSLRGTHVTISPIGDEQWKGIYSKYFPRIDGFHAVAKSMIPIAENFGVNPKNIKVVRSGLDLEKLPILPKTEINKSIKILSIGRSHWAKGYSYALDAMNLLDAKNIDFNYTIVGVDKNEELLYKRSQYKCKDQITFIGKLSFDEVKDFIKDADVLLLSSVEEGIANVVLEAMALGTLVVSTDCGGMNEVIIDNENGYLVPSRNPEAIADRLKSISEMPLETYLYITDKARTKVEQQHSHKCMVEDMSNLYQFVIKEEL